MNDVGQWMGYALELAARGRGFVEPNPMVGAVVLDASGQKVGEGWHQKFGSPHAEVFALEQAGEKARGGTLIVTLEPCCHHGKTPPCTDAVLKAGIARVIVAMADPFPKVSGGGLKLLTQEGLEVRVGIGAKEAERLNAPYLKLLGLGRPWVHAKWAMTLDGKIATPTGDSKWISGAESRRRVHDLRGKVDAILVGRGTVVADNPLLTARPPGPRKPERVIVSASGYLPQKCQLLATARESPVIVYTAQGNEQELFTWKEAGAEVIGLPHNDTALSQLSPVAILNDLGRRRFTHVLLEGGAGLLGSFLDANAIDEFHVYIAPKLAGAGSSPITGRGIERMADALRLVEFTSEPSGEDVYLHGFAH